MPTLRNNALIETNVPLSTRHGELLQSLVDSGLGELNTAPSSTLFGETKLISKPSRFLQSTPRFPSERIRQTPQHDLRPARTTTILNQDIACVIPPSACMSAPVIKLLSSDARNRATLAISSGVPNRPSGMLVASFCS